MAFRTGNAADPASEPGPAPEQQRPSIDAASVASGSAAALDSIAETDSAVGSGPGLGSGSVRSSLDVEPAAGTAAGSNGMGSGPGRSTLGRHSGGPAGVTFNRSAARARARGLRPSMELRRKKLDFSALQVSSA